MNRTLLRLAGPLALATWLALTGASPALAQGACLSNVEVQAAIARGDIAPLALVLQGAGIGRGTQVLSVEVCEDGGGWAYFVGLLDSSGEARTLVLRASG